jgi:hypothetical protein
MTNSVFVIDYNNLDKVCGKWEEITEERFYEMLEVLPPLEWKSGGFFLSELWAGDVGYFFQEWNGKFYESKQRTSYKRADIQQSLMSFISVQSEAVI